MLNLSKKILVTIDGSPQSDKAAEEAIRFATIPSKQPNIVYAILVLPQVSATSFSPVFSSGPPTEQPDWEEKRKKIFYVVEKAAREAKVHLEPVIVYGNTAEEILNFAEQNDIDVIVIGSSGAGMVKRALLGSVSAKVAMDARCSVYIVR